MKKTFFLTLAVFAVAHSLLAVPRPFPRASVKIPPSASYESDPNDFDQLKRFPHQVASCDFIGTGMVLATNDGYSATLAVGEILWGHAASSNITVRQVDASLPTEFLLGKQYLVLAYTNDWWNGAYSSGRSYAYTNGCWKGTYSHNKISLISLYDYTSPTNRPPSHAVFSDYRILTPRGSAISFDKIIVGGTNYWDATRTFITNFIDIAKFQNSNEQAYKCIAKIVHNEDPRLPKDLFLQVFLYYVERFSYDKGAELYGWE